MTKAKAEPAESDEPKAATLEDLAGAGLAEETLVISLPDGQQRALRIRALPGDRYDELVGKHPPDPKRDVDAYGLPLRFNSRTLAPALVAACLVEPMASEAEVRSFWAGWSKADRDLLYLAAFSLNERDGHLGKASPDSAPIPDDGDSSDGASTTG